VLPLASAPASAGVSSALIATPPGNCHSSFDPYRYTRAALAACGIRTFARTAVRAMPGGGTSYDYSMDGGTVRTYVPPAAFDPSTATAAQLNEYGFPPRPTDPGALRRWRTEMSNWKGTAPPAPFLAETGVHMDSMQSPTWSGYVVTEPPGTFNHAEMWYVEPRFYHSRCSANSELTWAGIGGAHTSTLSQDGTSHSALGLRNHQAWWEILPATAVPVKGIYGHPDYLFDASVRRITGGFRFFMYDYYFNISWATDVTGSAFNRYDGSSAEAIAERPLVNKIPTNLSNFRTIMVGSALANGSAFNTFNPVGHRHGVHMISNGRDLADPSGIGPGGSFTITQHNCN